MLTFKTVEKLTKRAFWARKIKSLLWRIKKSWDPMSNSISTWAKSKTVLRSLRLLKQSRQRTRKKDPWDLEQCTRILFHKIGMLRLFTRRTRITVPIQTSTSKPKSQTSLARIVRMTKRSLRCRMTMGNFELTTSKDSTIKVDKTTIRIFAFQMIWVSLKPLI